MTKQEVMALDARHYLPVFTRYPVALSRGEGPYVWDTEGKKYLDFLAGIAVNVLGHAHPHLVQAIAQQAGQMIHCSNLYYTEQQATLAARLAALSGLERVFFANSGAEANEGAIKLARKFGKAVNTDKIEIITAWESFHGRTLATLTATGQPHYQHGYEPLPAGFAYVPYNDLAALEQAMSPRTCAVMLEAIQGEGGIHVPDAGYLPAVRQLCDRYGAVLICDEVQAGMGRTGKLFAFQHWGVQPDIVTMAKGLGGGVPIGALLAREQVAQAFHPGDHGTTFGGNPLACAAAHATLDVLAQEQLPQHAAAMGEYFMAQLRGLQAKYPALIKAVRGKGLMVGVEVAGQGPDIVAAAMRRGGLINCTAGKVLRLVPPLIVRRQHVDEMVAILDAALGDLC